MDFGKILEQWEKGNHSGKNKKSSSSVKSVKEDKTKLINMWIDKYGVYNKDEKTEEESEPSVKRKNLKEMKPQATIDLHGMTTEQAKYALESFFDSAEKRGLKKVLIIHGKGKHSQNGSVLKNFVKTFLEQHPNAGESGYNKNSEGGSGSCWVIIKR